MTVKEALQGPELTHREIAGVHICRQPAFVSQYRFDIIFLCLRSPVQKGKSRIIYECYTYANVMILQEKKNQNTPKL